MRSIDRFDHTTLVDDTRPLDIDRDIVIDDRADFDRPDGGDDRRDGPPDVPARLAG